MILLEYQNIKTFLQKAMFRIGLKRFLWLKKLKKAAPWTYVISQLKGKEIFKTFYEKEFQKTNQQEFRVEKVIKKKDGKLYVKWIILLTNSSFNSWLIKKT